MNSNAAQDNSQQQEAGANGPGKVLQRARINLNLSVEAVASKLCLTTAHIKRIEIDDYSVSPGVTFERGYIRAYCRLLQLPEEEVLRTFSNIKFAERAPHKMPATMYKPPITARGHKYKWLLISIACIFILIGFVWTQMNNDTGIQLRKFTGHAKNLSQLQSSLKLSDNQLPLQIRKQQSDQVSSPSNQQEKHVDK